MLKKAERVAGPSQVPLHTATLGSLGLERAASRSPDTTRIRRLIGQPGPCQIHAAINAVHSDAPTAPDTDWGQILKLYDQLSALAPGPVVSLHRAVAVAEVHGPAAALVLVEDLKLERYHLFHAIRADLLRAPGALRRRGSRI